MKAEQEQQDSIATELSEAPEVMTVDEAAAFLRINPKTLREALDRGEVPGRRIGRIWRLERSGLINWLANKDKKAG